ncbi:MAG: hypothetical protein J0M17_04595 [Planctomycetes bacterium]|nr:hypothetical protein [Planctomycetota bacterium]
MRTVFAPLGDEFQSVIVAGLFSANAPLPQNPLGLGSEKRLELDDLRRYEYMAAWYETIKNCGWYAVILHDGLSPAFIEKFETPRIRFAYYPTDAETVPAWPTQFPPHERRFFAARAFLKHHTNVRFALLTDINHGGILVKADPLDFFHACHGNAPSGTPAFEELVFVSEENDPMGIDGRLRPFWREHTAPCDPKYRRLFLSLSYPQSLCVGIWGAGRATALAILNELVEGLVQERESGRRIVVPIDQVVFAYLLLTRFRERMVNFYSCAPHLWYRGQISRLDARPYAWFRRPTTAPLLISDLGLVPPELRERNDVLRHRAAAFYCPIARAPQLSQHDLRWWRPGDLIGEEPVRYRREEGR